MFIKHFTFAIVLFMGQCVFSSEGQPMLRYDFPPSVQIRKWVGTITGSNLIVLTM